MSVQEKIYNNNNNNKSKIKQHNELNNNNNLIKSKENVLTGKKLEDVFNAATDTIQNLPKNGSFQPSNELLLKFYGYFKQATCGPINKPRPGMFKVVERAKWDAWDSVKKLSKEEAMNAYIEEIKNIVETMPHNDTVQKFLDILGPFYEYVDENNEPINNNNDKNMSDLNDSNDKINFVNIEKQNGNSDLNNTNDITDDEEDFCDTNDNIDTIQTIKTLKSKLNNNNNNNINGNDQIPVNGYTNGLNGHYDDESEIINKQNHDLSLNENINMATNKINNHEPLIIQQYGGESNREQSNYSMQSQHVRPSRPNSSHSINSLQRGNAFNNNQSGGTGSGGGAGGGGGFQPPNDPYSNLNYFNNNDSNRQILLLLMRLQQDTNNVLTRLSYLETTVMSIQNSLQMNRIESTIQLNQNTNGYSNGHLNSSFSIWNYLMSLNIDWKTLFIALIGPIIIRLVLFLIKRLKIFIKIKRK